MECTTHGRFMKDRGVRPLHSLSILGDNCRSHPGDGPRGDPFVTGIDTVIIPSPLEVSHSPSLSSLSSPLSALTSSLLSPPLSLRLPFIVALSYILLLFSLPSFLISHLSPLRHPTSYPSLASPSSPIRPDVILWLLRPSDQDSPLLSDSHQ